MRSIIACASLLAAGCPGTSHERVEPDGGPFARDAGPFGRDAGPRRDAGRPDAPDAAVDRDAGASDRCGDHCGTGMPCDPVRGCAVAGHHCQRSLSEVVGAGTSDPIDGFPGSVELPIFGAGYCTTAPVNRGMRPPSCDLRDDSSCPECSRCASLGVTGGIERTFCARECFPSMTDDACCDGTDGEYTCLLGENYCLDGCRNDDQCRVFRLDSNLDGDIEPPSDAAPPVDRLEYRTSASHRCDTRTDRCVHDGTPGAAAGDACSWDGDCEANGVCFYGDEWNALDSFGYCSKPGCDVPGNSCSGGGKCQRRGFAEGPFLCLQPCEVARNVGDPGDPNHRFAFASGCRPGHRCSWDELSALGSPDGGACVLGNYNPLRTPNIGDACRDDAECYSPFGNGGCDAVLRGDDTSCTVAECAAPGMPSDLCGIDPPGPAIPAATCMAIGAESFCRRTCGAATECGSGSACMPSGIAMMVGIMTAHAICTPFCFGFTEEEADAQCRSGERCGGDFVPGASLGTCS
jgi:hypothetical protein